MKNNHLANHNNNAKRDSVTKGGEWARFILLMLIILPIFAFCIIGAYGLGVWIMQLLFWGSPA